MHHNKGSSLIEVVVAIVVVAVGVTGLFSVFTQTAKRSAEPVIINQALYIASAYLDEILQKDFTQSANPAGRANFNDVDDFNNINDNNGPLNQLGLVATLGTPFDASAFNITVAVDPASVLNNIPVKTITVTVTHDSWAIGNGNFNQDVTLIGHKADSL
ncbi:MAG: hypothetical protein HOM11_06895 [Methylococcales bacterium]|jgi:MSHA pilin protein MshD|nr:hypothetical protein [Methylococcales bacterium]MBT7445077.1 hypothetical protein [Methylococcales bacterium]